jgi:hypothetical protein
MMTAADFATVYEFVKATGENNIRKMMTGPKMTAAHVGLLLKVVRSTTSEEFGKHGEAGTYPKIKFTNNEDPLKDTFWKTASETFVQLGLVTVTKTA